MSARQVQFLDIGNATDRRRIAVLQQPAQEKAVAQNAPGIFWLQGFKSQMISLKASALADWTGARGLAFTRFDYSGHGQSSGRFEDGSISAWLEEAEAVFARFTSGPQILVGSSMGGWLALLLLRHFMARSAENDRAAPAQNPARIKGLVLIAPAWDMSEELMWKPASAAIKEELRHTGVYLRKSQYNDGPYAITMKLIEDGRNHLIAPDGFDPRCPVLVLHGALDPDVPFSHSMKLQQMLAGGHVRITRIPDGEHRLSRPADLARLFALIETLL